MARSAEALKSQWLAALSHERRVSPHTLRAYLAHGFCVALTGSKFVAGPPFSGALLVPRTLARRLERQAMPPALGAYSARAEWPRGWTAARSRPISALGG